MANALVSSSPTLPSLGNHVRPAGVRKKRSFAPVVIRCASLLACIAFWHVASTNRWNVIVNFENVPSPGAVCQAAVQLISSPKFQSHLLSSIARVFSGFGCAAVLSIAIGLGVGRSKLWSDILMPPLELLRPIPAVAWIPLAVLMFPNPEESMVYITFVGAFYPILLNTIHGVSSVDSNLIFASLTLGANRLRVFSDVIVPAALPAIVTGLSIGMGNSWFSVVTAEMVAGQFGIGYYTWESYTLQKYPNIVLGMIAIGLLGMLSSLLIQRVAWFFMPWAKLGVNR
ncbi:MAG: ABC transporter permease [Verrucomicrobia bacterium]|nr:ABC transporter permease [Verrucomicrobiota bacterium]